MFSTNCCLEKCSGAEKQMRLCEVSAKVAAEHDIDLCVHLCLC